MRGGRALAVGGLGAILAACAVAGEGARSGASASRDAPVEQGEVRHERPQVDDAGAGASVRPAEPERLASSPASLVAKQRAKGLEWWARAGLGGRQAKGVADEGDSEARARNVKQFAAGLSAARRQ